MRSKPALRKESAGVYAPDGTGAAEALARTTHLAVVAHQDDVEVLAIHGVLACYDAPDRWLTAVVVTSGVGAPRGGAYAETSDDELREIRRAEQKLAADRGRYGAVVFLDYSSDEVRTTDAVGVAADVAEVVRLASPSVVYTHALADAHRTHLAVALRTIEGLRAAGARPERVLGCEVWRDLDWLPAEGKVLLDVSARPDVQREVIEAFASQSGSNKRYDLAALARRRAHATFLDPYAVDEYEGLTLAMDLTPLVLEPDRSVGEMAGELVDGLVDGLRRELRTALAAVAGGR